MSFIADSWAAALPGERCRDEFGFEGTATNDYMILHGELFRRFAWCNTEIAHSPAFSPRGEWLAVRAHWKQFQAYQKKAACEAGGENTSNNGVSL